MAYVSYTSFQSLEQDHVCTCDKCGRSFTQYARGYGRGSAGHGTGVLSVLTNAASRDSALVSRTANGAAEKGLLRCLLYPHRCTECGHYAESALRRIRDAYPEYHRRQRAASRAAYVSAVIVSCIFWFGFSSVSHVLALSLALPLGSILALSGFIWAPMSQARYEQQVALANSSDAVLVWRAKLRSFGRARLDDLLSGKPAKVTLGHVPIGGHIVAGWNAASNLLHNYDPWWRLSSRFTTFAAIRSRVRRQRIARMVLGVPLGACMMWVLCLPVVLITGGPTAVFVICGVGGLVASTLLVAKTSKPLVLDDNSRI